MKVKNLLFIAFLFLQAVGKAQTFVDLGNSGYNQSENYQLVPTTFGSAKVQVLIKASELSAAGLTNGAVISGIAYYVQTDNTPSTISVGWYADFTTTAAFASTNFVATPTFRGSSTDNGTLDNSWRNVTFSSPLTWDGTSDLLIQSCRTSAAQGNSDKTGYFTTPWSSSVSGYLYHSCADAAGEYVQNFRPQIGISYTAPQVTLPVRFTNVNVVQQGRKTELFWKTSHDEGTIGYVVERSSGGAVFLPQATVALNNQGDYFWIDPMPEPGVSFYRIKSIQQAGNVLYSPVVKTSAPGSHCQLEVAPNPVVGGTTVLQLSVAREGVYPYAVFNMSGQQVGNGTLVHKGTTSSHVLSLGKPCAPGLYSVHVFDAGKIIAETKLIVL